MPESYGWETIETAEELYILDGLTFEQVAERTKVSVSQLKRWSVDAVPTWPERRREYRQAKTSVRRGVMLAKAKLIDSVLESQDPQKAYAFASLVSSSKVIEEEAQQRAQNVQPPIVTFLPAGEQSEQPFVMVASKVIRTPQDAVEALQEAVQAKINTMLTSPGELSFAALKDTKATMEMIEQLQAKYKPAVNEVDKRGGLSDEAADAIRKQILGLSK